jgi:hypothetical protein
MNIQARPTMARIVSPSVAFTREEKNCPILFGALAFVLQPNMKRKISPTERSALWSASVKPEEDAHPS